MKEVTFHTIVKSTHLRPEGGLPGKMTCPNSHDNEWKETQINETVLTNSIVCDSWHFYCKEKDKRPNSLYSELVTIDYV